MDFREMWLFLFLIFFSKNLPRKLKFLFKPDKYNGRFTFTIISRSVLLRMRNVSDKFVEKKHMNGFSWNVVFFYFWSFFLNLPRKLKFLFKPDKHNGHFTFTIISRSVLLRMRNVSDRICREKTHEWIFVKCGYFYFLFFFSKNLPRKLKFLFKPDKYNRHFTFTIISRSVLLRMRNVSDRICREIPHF
jgi:hypothetical protein